MGKEACLHTSLNSTIVTTTVPQLKRLTPAERRMNLAHLSSGFKLNYSNRPNKTGVRSVVLERHLRCLLQPTATSSCTQVQVSFLFNTF